MGKLIVVGLAVLATAVLLPGYFPALHHTAFKLGDFAVSWTMLACGGVLFLGTKGK